MGTVGEGDDMCKGDSTELPPAMAGHMGMSCVDPISSSSLAAPHKCPIILEKDMMKMYQGSNAERMKNVPNPSKTNVGNCVVKTEVKHRHRPLGDL